MTNNTGKKHDTGKIRMDLVPFDSVEEIAKILGFGAQKYDEYNWTKGMDWSRLLGATFRHLSAWQRGEDIDHESNLPHLAHAACSLLFLIYYAKYDVGTDDRHKRSEGK